METSKGCYGYDIPSIKDGPVEFLSELEHLILLERMKNKNYRNIAEEFNLSRRQVHEISKEAWRKLDRAGILYKEDALGHLYMNFHIGYSVFTNVFGDEQTYYYLRNRHRDHIKGWRGWFIPIEEFSDYKGLLRLHSQRLKEYLLPRKDPKES